MRHAVAVATSLLVLAASLAAHADPPHRAHRVITATGIVYIHGEPQRPQAFNVSARSTLGYAAPVDANHFVDRVLNATRASPF